MVRYSDSNRNLVWYAIEGLLLLGCIVLLWKAFARDAGWFGFIWLTALVLAFRPVYVTFNLRQVSFITLLMMMLFRRYRFEPRRTLTHMHWEVT